ncbi:MAG: hypothetical protein QOI12_2520 [Alphaproteobacteria bacterium]|jgi:hypothetical protein|nr:hypothetical protein [Alphaproteobacteria bacterium]
MMSRPSSLWHREGLLVSVKKDPPWWVSHAQLPTVLPLSDRLWRVYFGARDRDNRTRILAVDLDPGEGMRILAEHVDALLDRGLPGAFDHEGVIPSAVLEVDGHVRLYYIGVTVRRDVRRQSSIGLAVSDDGLSFRKQFAGPVHGTGPFDSYFNSAPVVRRNSDGYRMWYVGGTEWRQVNGTLEPFYEIRTTRSTDGLIWDVRSENAVSHQPSWVTGLGRPWIVDNHDGQRLWFSRRGNAYRTPGDNAYRLMSIRVDERGASFGSAEPLVFDNPSAAGDFDSWMQAYACVIPHGEDLIMFYNGDGFGKTGFGWARLRGGRGSAERLDGTPASPAG